MHEKVREKIHAIVDDADITVDRVLEVGGYIGPRSLLRTKRLRKAKRYCINLVEYPDHRGIEAVHGSAHNMTMFEDASFDIVLCNAMLEHDPKFWLSLREMKRVLRPGGLLVIGVPGFVDDDSAGAGKWTPTFKVHMRGIDYYRFSPRAVEEVFFEGMTGVDVTAILSPPRLVSRGQKPLT